MQPWGESFEQSCPYRLTGQQCVRWKGVGGGLRGLVHCTHRLPTFQGTKAVRLNFLQSPTPPS